MVLRAGKGAKGSVLTRLINPKQVHDEADVNHRSDIVIVDRYANKKGTVYFRFRYKEDQHEEGPPPLHCAASRIRILEEGDPDDIFEGPAPQIEDRSEPHQWERSKARKILYEDIKSGLVDADSSPEEVYVMHPEYSMYHFDKFKGRMKSLFTIVNKLNQ